MANVRVQAQGLAEFRRDVRRADKEIGKQLQRELREVSQRVAEEAGASAPRQSGTLAGSYRGSARGSIGLIRSTNPVARFIEFGFHPRGGTTFVEGTNIIGQAVEKEEDNIIDGIGDAVERAAIAMGWR